MDHRQGAKPLEIEEARRLLYVGMTRTMDRLVMTHVLTRGGKQTGGHHFLDEMGATLVISTGENMTERAEWKVAVGDESVEAAVYEPATSGPDDVLYSHGARRGRQHVRPFDARGGPTRCGRRRNWRGAIQLLIQGKEVRTARSDAQVHERRRRGGRARREPSSRQSGW